MAEMLGERDTLDMETLPMALKERSTFMELNSNMPSPMNMAALPLALKERATFMPSPNMPSPSDFGLTPAQVKSIRSELEDTKTKKCPVVSTDSTSSWNQTYGIPQLQLADIDYPKPEDFGITADTLVPPPMDYMQSALIDEDISRPPRPSDFGIDANTIPIPSIASLTAYGDLNFECENKSETSSLHELASSHHTPRIARPTIPDLTRCISSPAICRTPITPSRVKRSQLATPRTPLLADVKTPKMFKSHSDNLITPSNTFRLNKVQNNDESPFDSPEQTLQLKMPPSYMSPIQLLQTQYNIRPIEDEEFSEVPSYLRIGVKVRQVNEVLLTFGKMSGGDRNFTFRTHELNGMEIKVRPLLRRLGRIILDPNNGEFNLK